MMNGKFSTLVASGCGTTLMTAFSHLASVVEKENLSEPEHLSTLFGRLVPVCSKTTSRIAGWGAHYAVGAAFMLAYQKLWQTGKLKKTLKHSMAIGAVSGAVAVLIWKKTMESHPAPPLVNFTKFYVQLVPAHIVFAVCATLTSQLLESSFNTPQN